MFDAILQVSLQVLRFTSNALKGVLKSQSAFLGHFDFIYALPGAWLSVPFTFLGRY